MPHRYEPVNVDDLPERLQFEVRADVGSGGAPVVERCRWCGVLHHVNSRVLAWLPAGKHGWQWTEPVCLDDEWNAWLAGAEELAR